MSERCVFNLKKISKTQDLIGDILAVLPTPSPSNVPGYDTFIAFELATDGQRFRFSIDRRGASFLAHALMVYLNPFQSEIAGGTPSDEAEKPSA